LPPNEEVVGIKDKIKYFLQLGTCMYDPRSCMCDPRSCMYDPRVVIYDTYMYACLVIRDDHVAFGGVTLHICTHMHTYARIQIF
jgi:hypothetical protein